MRTNFNEPDYDHVEFEEVLQLYRQHPEHCIEYDSQHYVFTRIGPNVVEVTRMEDLDKSWIPCPVFEPEYLSRMFYGLDCAGNKFGSEYLLNDDTPFPDDIASIVTMNGHSLHRFVNRFKKTVNLKGIEELVDTVPLEDERIRMFVWTNSCKWLEVPILFDHEVYMSELDRIVEVCCDDE